MTSLLTLTRAAVRTLVLAPLLAVTLLGAPASASPATSELAPLERDAVAAKTIAPAIHIEPKPRETWVLPLQGYHLTARFGASSGPWAHNHTGLDFAVGVGTPIRAVTDGVVLRTGREGAYGNLIVITDPSGNQHWYAHQNEILVVPGQLIKAGDTIGEVGSTGNVTGPHLHLETRTADEVPQNPEVVLAEHGVHP